MTKIKPLNWVRIEGDAYKALSVGAYFFLSKDTSGSWRLSIPFKTITDASLFTTEKDLKTYAESLHLDYMSLLVDDVEIKDESEDTVIRDQFASEAIGSIVSMLSDASTHDFNTMAKNRNLHKHEKYDRSALATLAALLSFEIADAMLEARKIEKIKK